MLALGILWGEWDSLPFPNRPRKSGIPSLPLVLCNATCAALDVDARSLTVCMRGIEPSAWTPWVQHPSAELPRVWSPLSLPREHLPLPLRCDKQGEQRRRHLARRSRHETSQREIRRLLGVKGMFDHMPSSLLCTPLSSLPRGWHLAAYERCSPAPVCVSKWQLHRNFNKMEGGNLQPVTLRVLSFLCSFAPSLCSPLLSAGFLCPWSAFWFLFPGNCLVPLPVARTGGAAQCPPRWGKACLRRRPASADVPLMHAVPRAFTFCRLFHTSHTGPRRQHLFLDSFQRVRRSHESSVRLHTIRDDFPPPPSIGKQPFKAGASSSPGAASQGPHPSPCSSPTPRGRE